VVGRQRRRQVNLLAVRTTARRRRVVLGVQLVMAAFGTDELSAKILADVLWPDPARLEKEKFMKHELEKARKALNDAHTLLKRVEDLASKYAAIEADDEIIYLDELYRLRDVSHLVRRGYELASADKITKDLEQS
jgi:hypothetical protein